MADSLFDVISAATGSGATETPNAELETELETEAETETELETEEETTDEGDTGEETPVEGDEPAAGEEPELDADGKPVVKPAAKTPEQLAAEEAAKPKPKDPINDPIPNALKPETKARMTTLVTVAKTLTRERDTAVSERDEILGYIEKSGANAQQYGDALNYLELVNSGDPVKQEQALAIMQGEVNALARMLGKPVAGVDMLSAHADLKEAVADGSISQQHAEELAASRERGKIQTAQGQQRQQTQAQELQTQAVITAGKAALTALGNSLAADPQFAAKRAILVPALKATFAKSHPSTWAATFKNAYDNLKLPAAPAPVPRTKVPANQPMRAQARSGAAVPEPKSMHDALSAALGVRKV